MSEGEFVDATARAGLTADLLALGRSIDLWSSGLSLLVIAVLLFTQAITVGLIVSLALGAAAKGYALRVRLDEGVFRRWSRQWSQAHATDPAADMAAFDRSLGRPVSSRSLEDRCRGARRLIAWQMLTTLVQTASVLLVAIIGI
jgi:hypothetical protein